MARYSLSQLGSFMRCPHAWYWHYIEKIKQDTFSLPIICGWAVEAGLNKLVETEKDEAALDALYERFENEAEETEESEKKLEQCEKAYELISYKIGNYLINSRAEMQAHLGFKIGNDEFIGFLDYVIPSQGKIIDLKTTGRMWPEGEENKKDQHILYPAYLFFRDPNLKSVDFEYHIVTIAKIPKYSVRKMKVTREETFDYIDSIKFQIEMIKDLKCRYQALSDPRVFPANRSSWLCSRKNCAAWNFCEKTNHWKIKE